MINRLKIIPVIILFLMSESVTAARWSIGGNLGLARGEMDTGQLNNELASRAINAQASDSDVKRIAQQLYIGYEFTSTWGMELGYVDLGDVEVTIDGTIQGINAFVNLAEEIYPQTAQGWQISGVYRYPINGNFQFMGKAGVFQWTSDYTLQVGTISKDISEDGTDFSIGLGLEAGRWIMQDGIVGLLGWELYKVDGESINMLLLGVSYRF